MQSSSPHVVELLHPSGASVLLLGARHCAVGDADRAAALVQQTRPVSCVLEVDEARFRQLDFRLAHMLHANTARLMQLLEPQEPDAAPAGSSSWWLPDAALRWAQQRTQFALVRSEGVALMLGGVYGGEMAAAALAAAGVGAGVVLGDRPQDDTLARYAALAAASGQLAALLQQLLPWRAHADAAAAALPKQQQQQHAAAAAAADWRQLRQVLAAAVPLAAARMAHHALQWAGMACSSQARWMGENVHPVFLLVGDARLQARLAAGGCRGVPEAAAVAGRLLQLMQDGGRPLSLSSAAAAAAAGDLQALRTFVASLEEVVLLSSSPSGASPSSASCSRGTQGSSSSSNVRAMRDSITDAASSSSLSCLLHVQPWWLHFSNTALGWLGTHPTSSSGSLSGSTAAAGGSLAAALRGHHHTNIAAAAAYEQAVVAERNTVLTDALWRQAAEAASKQQAPEQQQQQSPVVVGVVGANHLQGIQELWQARLLATQQEPSAGAGGDGAACSSSSNGQRLLPWQLLATDALAGALELAAAGGAGLAYVAGVQRWARRAAAASSSAAAPSSGGSGGSGSGWRWRQWARPGGPALGRLGLLLAPAALVLLPLQRDTARMQDAGRLLTRLAGANDAILTQQLDAMDAMDSSSSSHVCDGDRRRLSLSAAGHQQPSSLLRLAVRFQAAAAAAATTAG